MNKDPRQFQARDQPATKVFGSPRTKVGVRALLVATLVGGLAVGAASVPAYGTSMQSVQGSQTWMTSAVTPNVVPGAYDYPVTSTITTGYGTADVAANPATNRVY